MPRYHEQFGRPLNADPGTRDVIESPTRGSLEWMDVLTAIVGFGFQESERILDAAIECTFPASDPIAVHSAFRAACEREATPPDDLSASYEVCAEEVNVWPRR